MPWHEWLLIGLIVFVIVRFLLAMDVGKMNILECSRLWRHAFWIEEMPDQISARGLSMSV